MIKCNLKSLISVITMMLMIGMASLFGQNPNSENTNQFTSNNDPSCEYPVAVLSLAKYDYGIPDGESEIIYFEVEGTPNCGNILVNPKAGNQCFTNLQINGPVGNVSFTDIGSIEESDLEYDGLFHCSESGNQAVVYCDDGSNGNVITFLGWEYTAGGSSSIWYYRAESNVSDCQAFNAISHVTFGLLSDGSCPEVTISCPDDVSIPNCSDQSQVNNAFLLNG